MAAEFELYLRTGRRTAAFAGNAVEHKFNPWHDPEDGRFTFAGQGRYFSGGSRSAGRARTSGAQRSRTDPKNPRNYSLYSVKRGDTLTKIAGLRKGLTAADLAWLNDISGDRPLQIGQRIRIPHQQFLDEGKRARDSFLALAHYMDATAGKLPPNLARPPSIAVQVEASGLREISANGYRYDVDVLLRTRRVSGAIRLKVESRSRSAQANAGKPDRRGTDDGGHYIAARFNGPREWFNHFAQDANFNRGAYRAIEDGWAREVGAGKRVFVDIVPHYRGTSMRPYMLSIVWVVDGKRFKRDVPNEPRGR